MVAKLRGSTTGLKLGEARASYYGRILTAATRDLSKEEIVALASCAATAAFDLNTQNSMQMDNRQWTMVMNIIKTKHATIKNCIGNIH